jgi:hypothetical protein
MSTFSLMCRSKGRCLVISSSYRTSFLFIISSLSYNITYLFSFATSYSCTPFMVLMWSYHWRSKYPFASVPLWEWAYNNPRHTLGYCYNYCFIGETHVQREVSHLFSPHPTTSGYSYYKKWFPYLDGYSHYWPNLHKYGVVNIDDDSTCSDNGYLGEDMILHQMNTRWWLHSPCYWNVWVFSFFFWFILDNLCIDHYRTSSTIFFSPLDVHFPLPIRCVHSLAMCANHNNFSADYSTWLGFFIFSTHHS